MYLPIFMDLKGRKGGGKIATEQLKKVPICEADLEGTFMVI